MYPYTLRIKIDSKKKKKIMCIGWDLIVWWWLFSQMHIGGNWHGWCCVSTELIAMYLDNSSCWSKVTTSIIPHPYHQEVSLDSLPWISLEKAHLPWAQVHALDTPSLKQPCPYLLAIIILLSSFSSNRDRISLWKALWISDTTPKADANFSVAVSVNVLSRFVGFCFSF